MAMIFTSSRFDPFIYRARRFLRMPFLPPSGGVAKSYPIRIVIQFSRYNEKVFHLFPLGKGKCTPLNGKIFPNEKTSSLIWTKGAEMHTQFQAFSKKFFEKIYPFTCSH
ncbi:hypothetical protein EUS_01210 [[Eubacterium] siraeum 70/3]|uniref:Uncharacterized protein n=1 Tax=[Eubacterium] siraeum 70/3 TaxID=657319 RepID=D4JQV9_9FIRM|nr:hypothetical protein EUS_01210 [[Eubacterium] siraeum 70/3]